MKSFKTHIGSCHALLKTSLWLLPCRQQNPKFPMVTYQTLRIWPFTTVTLTHSVPASSWMHTSPPLGSNSCPPLPLPGKPSGQRVNTAFLVLLLRFHFIIVASQSSPCDTASTLYHIYPSHFPPLTSRSPFLPGTCYVWRDVKWAIHCWC